MTLETLLRQTDRNSEYSDEWGLKQAAEQHLYWGSPYSSCSLSVFRNEQHIYRWEDITIDTIYVHGIDSTELPPGKYISDAGSLSNYLTSCIHIRLANPAPSIDRIPSESSECTRRSSYLEEPGIAARSMQSEGAMISSVPVADPARVRKVLECLNITLA
ncbi:hypothetical protein F5Y14DRAFT_415705 [Nemania sp. NC0429]|nr:hypothetical protein F5Y14DRAFT_415705 [Nemania sp. NC0429]